MLQLKAIRKSYTTANFTQVALDDVSIAFRDNEYVAILGPSGSGKTTMLNILGGLDRYDSGDLVIDGISTKKYRDRAWDTYRNNRVGFVFQAYNLIPHQTVLANVELALTLSGVSKKERRQRAKDALAEVGLEDHINKKPNQLSGGQMQRVAIARALINDPEILLADEPTGALDSKTSVQIMALLTKIANDRLVIMVTHNPELAERYATRTVSLSDGAITADSNPFEPTEADERVSAKPIRRAKMSFFTAIALSFNNLMTKKGRTFMTAFAGSIGIIGIAAILALANGVNNFIKNVEETTLSVYPLSIQSTGFDITSMLAASSGMLENDTDDANADGTAGDKTETTRVSETKMLSNMLSRIGSNDLAALKVYLESPESGIDPYIKSIEYKYNVTPQIFSPDTENGVHQINPDSSFSALGMGAGAGAGSFMSMGMSTDMFSSLLKDTSMLDEQYDVLAGHWPEEYNELVLVLSAREGVSDLLLYSMGLRDPDVLKDMISKLANDEDFAVPDDGTLEFTYDELMAVEFKLVEAADFYKYDAEYKVWTDKQDDTEYMKNLINEGTTLNIVGIVRPNPDAAATSLTAGLYYSSKLTDHLIDEANAAQIVVDQLAQPSINVFSGKSFDEEADEGSAGAFDPTSLVTVDEDAISNAFKFDTSALNVDFASFLDMSSLAGNLPPVPEPDLAQMAQGLNIETPSNEEISAALTPLMTQVIAGYFTSDAYRSLFADPSNLPTPDMIAANFTAYLNDPTVQGAIGAQLGPVLGAMIDTDAITAQVQGALQGYMQQVMMQYMSAVMTGMQSQIAVGMQQAMGQLTANMAGAMNIDTAAFAEAFQFNMDEKELTELMMSMMGSEEASSDVNLRKLGYADKAKPSSINIYPIDFESKGEVIKILDAYNDRMEAEGQDDRVITYTDIVGTLMSSVTDIVNMVSYVLVAFVAISLVVSSIMIGVITYISVLERKKEIGILRAIGASKSDISNVFNAETLIVGFVAGVLGIGITLLLTIPANAIVYAAFAVENVATLPWEAAGILVLVSMGLTFLAGLIPSSAASRKDPVEALRSE
ncbi:MAG: ABC transporter ATP-binding protein/permease [Coriobacteriales bacterium]|nr:ABC transporter ATP-binding protein/permease [Coriobacteriales bacterium]